MTQCKLAVASLACIAVVAPVHAGNPAQEKLLARRAAELDAYRLLAERVMGLHLSSTTTVRDFVTESDEIKTGVRAFIRGARPTAVRHLEDGTCEVDMELTLKSVITILKELHSAHVRGGSFRTIDFTEIRKFEKRETIQVTGGGAQRSQARDSAFENVFTGSKACDLPPAWKLIPVQKRLLARRAALLDGYRKLAEQVCGLQLSSTTSVRDFVTESDVIRTEVEAFLRGAREIETRYLNDGIVEVNVAVTVEEVVRTMERIHREHHDLLGGQRFEFESIRSELKKKLITATGQGATSDGNGTETSLEVRIEEAEIPGSCE